MNQNDKKQEDSNQEKSIFVRYQKEFIWLLVHFAITFIGFSLMFVVNQMHYINRGIDPNQPLSIREELQNEAISELIIGSILLGLFLSLVIHIPSAINRFRFKYEVHLVHELKLYFKEKRAKKIEKSQREKL